MTTENAPQIPPEISDYDWEQAFGFASPDPIPGYAGSITAFTRQDVETIIAKDDGANDGPEWIGVFKLRDGRFACLRAGCDYTGWDCQCGGNSQVASSQKDIIRFGLTTEERTRLGLQLKDDDDSISESV